MQVAVPMQLGGRPACVRIIPRTLKIQSVALHQPCLHGHNRQHFAISIQSHVGRFRLSRPHRVSIPAATFKDDCTGDGGSESQQSQRRPIANAFRAFGGVSLVLLAGLVTSVRPANAAQSRVVPVETHDVVDRSSYVSSHQTRQAHQRVCYTGIDLAEAAIGSSAGGSTIVALAQPDTADAAIRPTKEELVEQLGVLYHQYDAQDMDTSIKQFMQGQPVQQNGAGQEVEDAARTEDGWSDAFSTEVPGEHLTMVGDPSSLHTWGAEGSYTELTYTQFWTLVGDGSVERVMFYGTDRRSLLALMASSAPGGARTVQVAVPADPMLLDHLTAHGVGFEASMCEADRLHDSFITQYQRYIVPFLFVSMAFWMLHTLVLDPMPNGFKRKEFLRYRRDQLYVASKLNFRSPAREVRINKDAPDFIAWEDIGGIDDVKKEVVEVIEYLKNPAMLRQQGVARLGGVLLAGAPGTGKTLLAKSIAAESGVRMFTCSGTDFFDIYTGVGARRIRETFEMLRANAPAILFVDEFDALGAARGAQASGDESTSIINELLVQMDGFEDNNGVVVLGATNRPGAIDSALIRPGRFDRIIYMPLPDAEGRAKILQVHARDKTMEPGVNWYEVARSMNGFTGADCMGLMQRAQRMAARQGRECIQEEDMYAAMENKAVEAYSEMTGTPKPGQDAGVPDPISDSLRRAVAVYEAGKVLTAYITPEFEEIARVSLCPFDVITGYTLFVEDEEKTMDAVVTRADLESHMVVNLAGQCAEKLVMGQRNVTSLGSADAFQSNIIAREMVLSMGMGRRMGPVDMMHTSSVSQEAGAMLRTADPAAPNDEYFYHATDMSTEQARVAMAEVVELLEAGEAKAYYGLAINWKPLQALTQALLDRGTLQGKEVARILEENGVIHFQDPYTEHFGWDKTDGTLKYPHKPAKATSSADDTSSAATPQTGVLSGVKAKTWFAGTPQDAPRDKDGNFKYGWHWNMPYTLKRDEPNWRKKGTEQPAL